MSSADPTDLGFPLKGSFKRIPLPKLLLKISRAKLDGHLFVLASDVKKVVVFAAGQPVFVRSNVVSECLGQLLVRDGIISQDQCDQTLEAIRRTGKKQGELLVELGILSEDNLRCALETQLRHKLFEMFRLEDGRYQVKLESTSSSQSRVQIDVGTQGIIIAAIQATYEPDRVVSALERLSDRFPVRTKEPIEGKLELLEEEQYFLDCLDGSRTTREVVDKLATPPVPTPGALLYGLYRAGLIRFLREAKKPARRPLRPKIGAPGVPDAKFAPAHSPSFSITEFEDTPLPGQMPRKSTTVPEVLEVLDESMFVPRAGPDRAAPRRGLSTDLRQSEPDRVEPTFEPDEIDELDVDDLELVEVDEDGEDDDDVAEPAEFDVVTGALEPGTDARDADAEDGAVAGAGTAAATGIDPQLVALADALSVDEDLWLESTDEFAELLATLDESPVLDGDNKTAAVAVAGEHEKTLLGVEELDAVDDLDVLGLLPALGDFSDANLEPVDHGDADRSQVRALEESQVGADADTGISPAARAPTVVNVAPMAPMAPVAPAAATIDENAEVRGAVNFNEGELAMQSGDFEKAVVCLEEAYRDGIDVAELHAMLAFARFRASADDHEMATHALELLDYAEQMMQELDIVHAYRGAILHSLNDVPAARAAAEQALAINPFCDLAIKTLDALG